MTDPQWLTVCLWMIVVLAFWCAGLAINIRALRHQIDGQAEVTRRHNLYFIGLKKIFAFEFEDQK